MATLGWFDGELRPDGWFDAELQAAGWFDTELINTSSSGPIAYTKTLTSTLLASGNPRRKTTTSKKSGSITASSVISEKLVFTRFIGGSLTLAGIIKKKTSKKLLGVATAAGALRKKVSRKLLASLTSQGRLVKKTKRRFLGVVSMTSIQRRLSRMVSKLFGGIQATGLTTTQIPTVSTPSDDAPVALSFLRRYLGRR